MFKSKPVLDDASRLWMTDVFEWALRNFDAKAFFAETNLIAPTSEFFPGRDENPHTMAAIIFKQTQKLANLSNWPMLPVSHETITELETPKIQIQGDARNDNTEVMITGTTDHLIIPYDTELLRDPQVLIATYAHNMAHYLGSIASEPPPGGVENWPHVTELLAVFLGFGVIMANTAFTAKIRSCASCSGPSVERTNFLSQYDITYALAIYAGLKNIPVGTVNLSLKSTLRAFYKKAAKDVKNRADEFSNCLSYRPEY